MVIEMPSNINSSISGSKDFVQVLNKIYSAKSGDVVVLNFSNMRWIDANLLAALGAVLEENKDRVRIQYVRNSIQPKIEKLLAKNQFGRYFNISKVSDEYDTIIEYKITDGIDIKGFARYFKESVLLRNEMPVLSLGLRDKILENVLEIFGNAPMHGGCKQVYSCGQIFPQKNVIKFTIANTGHTIKENVIDYYAHILKKDEYPEDTISWATAEYNSTKKIVNGKSGGLGLFYLKQFIKENRGSITICSSDEVWQYTDNREKTDRMDNIFSGTMVTIEINTNDSNRYYLEEEVEEVFSEF